MSNEQTEEKTERKPLPREDYLIMFSANLSALDLIAFGQFVNHCKDKMTCLKIRVKGQEAEADL